MGLAATSSQYCHRSGQKGLRVSSSGTLSDRWRHHLCISRGSRVCNGSLSHATGIFRVEFRIEMGDHFTHNYFWGVIFLKKVEIKKLREKKRKFSCCNIALMKKLLGGSLVFVGEKCRWLSAACEVSVHTPALLHTLAPLSGGCSWPQCSSLPSLFCLRLFGESIACCICGPVPWWQLLHAPLNISESQAWCPSPNYLGSRRVTSSRPALATE